MYDVALVFGAALLGLGAVLLVVTRRAASRDRVDREFHEIVSRLGND